jgi:hypothetical protein
MKCPALVMQLDAVRNKRWTRTGDV